MYPSQQSDNNLEGHDDPTMIINIEKISLSSWNGTSNHSKMMQNKVAFGKGMPNKVVEMFDSWWIMLQIFEEKVRIISFPQQRTKGIED